MIFDLITITVNYLIGFALMFGIALLLTYLTKPTLENFIIWLTISSSFVCWAGLIEVWVVILNIMFLIILLFIHIKKGRSII